MYRFESNFRPVEAPDIYRIFPKIGREPQGRSNLPTIAHAIPPYPPGSRRLESICRSGKRNTGTPSEHPASIPESSSPSTSACSYASIRAAPSASAPHSKARHRSRHSPSAPRCKHGRARPSHALRWSSSPTRLRTRHCRSSAETSRSLSLARATQSAR